MTDPFLCDLDQYSSYSQQPYRPLVNLNPKPPRSRLLSTWGEAIVAAVTGDAVMMAELLQGKHNDGKGVDLRTFRTSWDDVDFLIDECNLRVDPHYTLAEIALERDHHDLVTLLLENPLAQDTPMSHAINSLVSPPALHRTVSTFVAPTQGEVNLADALRDHAFSTLTLRPEDNPLAGLPCFELDYRQAFMLAREAVELPLEARQVACGAMTEDVYTQDGVDAAVGWWAAMLGDALGAPADECLSAALPAWGLHALYTSGDGNCLLHAALLSTLGVRDTRIPGPSEPGASSEDELSRRPPRRSLRAALHHALVHCGALRTLLAYHGVVLEPAERDTAESRSVDHGSSCDPAHILLLAHIFRRPFICYAAASVGEVRETDDGTTMSSYASAGARMSGIYLPCLLPPEQCASRDPIAIAYTQGHFSALCSTESAGERRVWAALGIAAPAEESLPLPLCDETLNPLPVLFPPVPDAGADAARDDGALLASYMDVMETGALRVPGGAPAERRPIFVTRQRIPPPSQDRVAVSAADAYFSAVWARRVGAAAEPRAPRNPDLLQRAPSASKDNSWELLDPVDRARDAQPSAHVQDGVHVVQGEQVQHVPEEPFVVVEGRPLS